MIEYYIFIVEGFHDMALISGILNILKFTRIENYHQLGSPFESIIEGKTTINDTLDACRDIPSFFMRDKKRVCLISANGETKLIKTLDNTISKFRISDLDLIKQIVIFCDGDLKPRDNKIHDLIELSFSKNNHLEICKEKLINGFISLKKINIISIPNYFFVMPNNEDSGRLEQIILQAIEYIDKELLYEVDIFLERVPIHFKTKWSNENSKYDKTRIACVGNVNAPGSSMSAIISSGRWVNNETVKHCENLRIIYEFIKSLFN